ncbi:MAG: hypothetical protein P8L70_00510 [Halioglobus sp.]|nr:hypothetical protein [Halioglobus sp.]MDG2325186.1 hypothetical protein [Halioglobus sp.]
MSDSEKTKQELINELEALRAKMNGKKTDEPASGAAPTGDGMTRRDILAASWVAPLILTVPLGTAIVQRAQAQGGTGTPQVPTSAPTSVPTQPRPTSTSAPTLPAPTSAPTQPRPPGTSAPTLPAPTTVATSAPTLPAPTSFPTAAGSGPIPVELSDFDIS